MRSILLAAAVLCGWATLARAQESPLLAEAKALDAAAAKDDCAAASPLAQQLAADPAFAQLSDAARLSALTAATECSNRKHDKAAAYGFAVRATALPNVDNWIWTFRVEEGVAQNALDDVAGATEQLAAGNRVALNDVRPWNLIRFESQARKAGRVDLVKRVFAALERADYQPTDAAQSPDGLWIHYAEMEADAGDHGHASALLRRLTDVDALMQVSVDRRFTIEVAADPAHFDLRAAAEAQVGRDEAAMTAAPDRLQLVVEALRTLSALGRSDDALVLTQSALDRIAAAPKDKPAFVDEPAQIAWLYDMRADALTDLGRTEEGLQAERAGIATPQSGHANLSQVINLAGLLTDLGRPAEALDVLRAVDAAPDELTPYGGAWVHAERACADEQLGRKADEGPELAYLDAHAADNGAARLRADVCVGNLDGAAGELVGRLKNSDTSHAAMLFLCRFDPSPFRTPVADMLAARYVSVAARPDVQAAAATYGVVRTIHLNPDVFMDRF